MSARTRSCVTSLKEYSSNIAQKFRATKTMIQKILTHPGGAHSPPLAEESAKPVHEMIRKYPYSLHEWISFFIGCLVKQKDVLAARVEQEHLMTPLAPLSQELLGIVDSQGRITVRQAVALTGANRNTIKHHLRQLVTAADSCSVGSVVASGTPSPRRRHAVSVRGAKGARRGAVPKPGFGDGSLWPRCSPQ